MGGAPPVGYRIENRQLHINLDEAPIAEVIFDWYLKLGSVRALKQELDVKNIRSPKRVSQKGKHSGGKNFSRGALYSTLRNPVYIGQIKRPMDVVVLKLCVILTKVTPCSSNTSTSFEKSISDRVRRSIL